MSANDDQTAQTATANSGSVQRMVGLRSHRTCNDCMGRTFVGARVGSRWKFVKCKRCAGTGKLPIKASQKPNDQAQVPRT